MLQEIKAKHQLIFTKKSIKVSAPARINLIGEHTDYNLGFSLPAAVNLSMHFVLNTNESKMSHLYAYNLEILDSFKNEDSNFPKGHWTGLFKTVLIELKSRGFTIGGIDCTFGGDIPIGAGMSSSSALNCGFIFGLNQLYRWKLSHKDIMLIAQAAEHRFGVKGGLMDQYTILNGKKNHALLLDFLHLKHTYIPLQTTDYHFVLFNTCVKHSLVNSPYNQRRKSCESVLDILQSKYKNVSSYQDVNIEMLLSNQANIGHEGFQKASYVVEENERVLAAVKTLQAKDWQTFGQLLWASHEGLKTKYDVSCPELDFMVDAIRSQKGVLGSRMMGGGFGGCTLNLIHKDNIEPVWAYLQALYLEKFDIQAEMYRVEIGGGIKIH